MEIKSRICRASSASAARHRTPSRCRCLTSTPVPAGSPRPRTAGGAPGFPSRGTRPFPRGVRGAPPKAVRSWAGAAGTLASHTWLPVRYRQQQPQPASTARGRRERSVPSPPAREGGGGGGYGRGDPATPRPGRTSGRAPARRGRGGAVRSRGGCSSLRAAVVPVRACCARHRHRRSASGPTGARLQGSRSESDGELASGGGTPGAGRGLARHFPGFPEAPVRRSRVRSRMEQPGGPGTVPAAHCGEQNLPIPPQIRTPTAPDR